MPWPEQPLDKKDVDARRAAYEEARDALAAAAQIDAEELQSAVEANRVLERFGAPGLPTERVEALQTAYQALQAAIEQQTVRSILREFRNASVLTVGDTTVQDNVIHAESFQIKVANPKGLGDDDWDGRGR